MLNEAATILTTAARQGSMSDRFGAQAVDFLALEGFA